MTNFWVQKSSDNTG